MASGYYDGTGLADAIAPAMNNLGKAMFGDPTINANNAYKNQVLEMQRQKLDLENQELTMKSPLYKAQTAAANANAAENQRRADELQAKMRGSTDLGDIFSSAFVAGPNGQVSLNPDLIGKFASAAARANPALDPSKLAQSLSALSITQSPLASENDNRRAVIMMGGIPNKDTATTVEQANQLAENERRARIDAQRVANEPDYSKPLIVPKGSVVIPSQPFDPQQFSLNPQAQNQSSLANAVADAPSSQTPPAYYRDSATGAIVVPDKKSFAQVPSNPYVPYSPDPAQEKSAYNAWLKDNPGANNVSNLSSLNMLERFTDGKGNDPYQGYGGQALSFVPSFLGGNPAAQQFRQQSSILASRARTEPGSVSNYEQQLFLQRVPNLANNRESNAAIIQVGKIGAQKATEADIWLQRFIGSGGSFAQGQSLVNEYNSDARNLGVSENTDGTLNLLPNYPKIDQWYQEKLSGFQPTQTQQTQQPQPLADTVAGAAAPSASAIDPDIVKAMEIIARDPREKERVNQMLISAGKPPIK